MTTRSSTQPRVSPSPVPYSLKKASIAWLIVILIMVALLTVYHSVQQTMAERLQRDTANQLTTIQNQLTSTLERYAYLPRLLAAGREVQDVLGSNQTVARPLQALNEYLQTVNQIAGTTDIYVLDKTGNTIASSNWQKPSSFLGKNFSFRPYFQEAIQGQDTHYFALGTTSRERGYYFAAPVKVGKEQWLGVVTVKIGVDRLEAGLVPSQSRFMITDETGVVFMASQAEWLYHTLQTLPSSDLQKVRASRRYADTDLSPLQELALEPEREEQHVRINGRLYYVLHQDMIKTAGWHLYLLTDRSLVNRTATIVMMLVAILLLLSGLLVHLWLKNQRQRLDYDKHVREELAAKVEERTRELHQTQEELIQAAKMAVLGQISAGINHELNNPLTAIRSYADNAAQFLDRGHPEIARNNLLEIVALADRMALITRQLKTFSRKSAGEVETCDLHRALDSALNIVQPKLAQSRVQLHQQRAEHTRYVQADLVWLEQILVNLLGNAIEAVQEQAQQHIWIELQAIEGQIRTCVRDNGPGLSDAVMPHVFEAFFTTKKIGKGLGLGLSISYKLAKDMQGHLSVRNAAEGGAIFTLSLPQSPEGVVQS